MESRKDFCGYGTTSLLRKILQGLPDVFACSRNVPELYKCTNCDCETTLKVLLTLHFNQSHKKLENQNQFKNVLRQCGFCDFQTFSMLLLLKHSLQCDKRGTDEFYYKIGTWLECGQSSHKTRNIRYIRRHLRLHLTKMFHCDKCEYETKYKANLKKHSKMTHLDSANVVWYRCDKCEYKAKRKENLRKHLERMHTDLTNIVWHHCDKCEFKTKWEYDLKRHMKNVHTDSVNIVWYHCDKCKHKTSWKGALKKHIERMHTDLANIVWYHCDKCEYIAKWKENVTRHMKRIHTDSSSIQNIDSQITKV